MHWTHRVAFAWWHGSLPEGYVVDHSQACVSSACCNPEHLRLVTVAEHLNLPGHVNNLDGDGDEVPF